MCFTPQIRIKVVLCLYCMILNNMKPTFRQSINNTVEKRNLWIVLWVKERCSWFHSIEVTLNTISLFYFVQKNGQTRHEKMWEDFQSRRLFQLGFLLFWDTRNRIFKNHPLFQERWENECDLDLALSVASWCPVDYITVLEVQAKRGERRSRHSSLGSKS